MNEWDLLLMFLLAKEDSGVTKEQWRAYRRKCGWMTAIAVLIILLVALYFWCE